MAAPLIGALIGRLFAGRVAAAGATSVVADGGAATSARLAGAGAARGAATAEAQAGAARQPTGILQAIGNLFSPGRGPAPVNPAGGSPPPSGTDRLGAGRLKETLGSFIQDVFKNVAREKVESEVLPHGGLKPDAMLDLNNPKRRELGDAFAKKGLDVSMLQKGAEKDFYKGDRSLNDVTLEAREGKEAKVKQAMSELGEETKKLVASFKPTPGHLLKFSAALIGITLGLKKFSEWTLESQRHLAQFSGKIGAAFARLETADVHRDLARAKETAPYTSELADEFSAMKDIWEPIGAEVAVIGIQLARLGTWLAGAIGVPLSYLAGVAKWWRDKWKFGDDKKPDRNMWEQAFIDIGKTYRGKLPERKPPRKKP